MKILGLITLLFVNSVWALKPINGVILGKASVEEQSDPLASYFSLDQGHEKDERSLRLAYETFSGKELKRSCEKSKRFKFAEASQKKIAMRSLLATMQYIVLDLATKSIGRLAKKMSIAQNDYQVMAKNLVNNYCSKNISVYGHQFLKDNLLNEYTDEGFSDHYQHFSKTISKKISEKDFYKKTLANNIYLFRSFCSWGGDAEELGLINEFISDPIVMSALFNIIEGKKLNWSREQKKFVKKEIVGVGVLCPSLICRPVDFKSFKNDFPRALGTESLRDNFKNLYCHEFLTAKNGAATLLGNSKNWHKKEVVFADVVLKAELIGLMTQTPNYLSLLGKENTLDDLMTASYLEALNNWSENRLKKLSRELFYEESLEISSKTEFLLTRAEKKKYNVDLVLGLGEIDHHLKEIDKVTTTFNVYFPESFFAWVKEKMANLDLEKKSYQSERFYHQLHSKIKVYLQKKNKDFIISPFVPGLEKVIARDLISWMKKTPKKLLKSTSYQMIPIRVNMHYGLFALKYFYDRFQFQYR